MRISVSATSAEFQLFFTVNPPWLLLLSQPAEPGPRAPRPASRQETQVASAMRAASLANRRSRSDTIASRRSMAARSRSQAAASR